MGYAMALSLVNISADGGCVVTKTRSEPEWTYVLANIGSDLIRNCVDLLTLLIQGLLSGQQLAFGRMHLWRWMRWGVVMRSGHSTLGLIGRLGIRLSMSAKRERKARIESSAG